jgi:polygalacturonase
MNKIFTLVALFVLILFSVKAQKTISTNISTDIIVKNSTHIVRITSDSLILITGSTFSFDVDTPEDKGLVSVNTGVKQVLKQVTSKDGSVQSYVITNKDGIAKTEGDLVKGDLFVVSSQDGKNKKAYHIALQPMAIGGQLLMEKNEVTVNTTTTLTLYFTAGQRSPNTTVRFFLPEGITITPENTTINVIGRGDVLLKDLATQSMGRLGTNYTYKKVGNFGVYKNANGIGSSLLFKHLDLRPANGVDLKIVISNVILTKAGDYPINVIYSTTKPEVLTSPGIGSETTVLKATNTISDFERVVNKDLQYKETPTTYIAASFKWAPGSKTSNIQLLQSPDKGKSWIPSKAVIDQKAATASITGLVPNKLYSFKLWVKEGEHKGFSNIIQFFSGKMDVKSFGVNPDGKEDNTEKINEAIAYLHQIGGGTLLFSKGVYSVRTVHLQSNVYLYVGEGAEIKALKGGDAPETTWFSDKKYRSGTSPTDPGPYEDPENWLTKQDVGHHYFRNSMFFAERMDNIKIIGNGLISGNGNLVNSDGVMKNDPDNRSDKMFTFKLCTNIEIGGIYRPEDLWYDEKQDAPFYFNKDGSHKTDTGNMLQIDRTGHFALLSTGTDNLNVHDTYFCQNSTSNVRDIYDFMACNNVTVTNIFTKMSSDDIIKPGSDCSLGFTRPAHNYLVRNIIGDSNCNLFQIGSETADDIQDVWVDNIYVLGANKAGFSISTNDGAHIKNVYLNSGKTGPIHSRSKMMRTTTPFFISISNRARILGANVAKFKFDDNGVKHNELLATNVNIGEVENIFINGVDVSEVYSGSSYGGKVRWKAYDASQKKSTAIVAGYALPDSALVEGGLKFTLPNGKHTGYIKNIQFNDVKFLYKGGNPAADTAAAPPELGVGQYNVPNLKVQPSYGLWGRHVMGLTINNCTFNYEKRDSRYTLFLDDVLGGTISSIRTVRANDINSVIKLKNSKDVNISDVIYFDDVWGKSPANLK